MTRPDDDNPWQTASELLDPYHPRASTTDGDRIMLDPGQLLENIANAMARLDLDINTPISIEEDVASLNELMVMVQNLQMGPTLAIHVLNTAMRIMSARYPAELVTTPLPPAYDVRKILPQFTVDDQLHDIAKMLFNRRTTSSVDLDYDDVVADFEPLDTGAQLQIFTTLFYMYGTKIGAMKHRTGIE